MWFSCEAVVRKEEHSFRSGYTFLSDSVPCSARHETCVSGSSDFWVFSASLSSVVFFLGGDAATRNIRCLCRTSVLTQAVCRNYERFSKVRLHHVPDSRTYGFIRQVASAWLKSRTPSGDWARISKGYMGWRQQLFGHIARWFEAKPTFWERGPPKLRRIKRNKLRIMDEWVAQIWSTRIIYSSSKNDLILL